MSVENKNKGSYPVNIVVGRFQPFTMGHMKIVETLYEKNQLPTVIVSILGINSTRNTNRPFTQTTVLTKWIKTSGAFLSHILWMTLRICQSECRIHLR